MHARVGNYPGVTVEKKIGRLRSATRRCKLVDLPGTYSLAPRSPDEMVSVEVLLGTAAGGRPARRGRLHRRRVEFGAQSLSRQPGARRRLADRADPQHVGRGATAGNDDRRAGSLQAAGDSGRHDGGPSAGRYRRSATSDSRGGRIGSARGHAPLSALVLRGSRRAGPRPASWSMAMRSHGTWSSGCFWIRTARSRNGSRPASRPDLPSGSSGPRAVGQRRISPSRRRGEDALRRDSRHRLRRAHAFASSGNNTERPHRSRA